MKYIYQDGNYLTGIVIDKIVGGRGDSFSDIFKGKYKNWSINLTLEVPLAGLLSRTSLARSRAAEEQARLQLEKQKRDIEFEVQDIVRELEAKARIIESSTKYRELAEKRVASETRRYQQGLVGSEWLISYRRELVNARIGRDPGHRRLPDGPGPAGPDPGDIPGPCSGRKRELRAVRVRNPP